MALQLRGRRQATRRSRPGATGRRRVEPRGAVHLQAEPGAPPPVGERRVEPRHPPVVRHPARALGRVVEDDVVLGRGCPHLADRVVGGRDLRTLVLRGDGLAFRGRGELRAVDDDRRRGRGRRRRRVARRAPRLAGRRRRLRELLPKSWNTAHEKVAGWASTASLAARPRIGSRSPSLDRSERLIRSSCSRGLPVEKNVARSMPYERYGSRGRRSRSRRRRAHGRPARCRARRCGR